jgi:hypothetical protein
MRLSGPPMNKLPVLGAHAPRDLGSRAAAQLWRYAADGGVDANVGV